MESDEITMLMPELIFNDDGKGVRLFAYSSAISGKEGKASASKEVKAKVGSGFTGLREELEKIKLDV